MNVDDFLQAHPQPPTRLMDPLVACIKACFACAESCTLCADACLAEEQLDRLRRCIRLNLDCAAICAATGEVVARQTSMDRELTRQQLESCVTACRVCGDECELHASMHDHCRLCMESCRACTQACNALLAAL